jgi:hypothetical protein
MSLFEGFALLDCIRYIKNKFVKKCAFIVSALLFFAVVPSFAQFYQTGQDPASIKWKQIKTRNYQLIFPSNFEKSAQNFASTLDTLYPIIGKQLLSNPKRISVLFHTQSSYANGSVAYAPKRMELYTMPPQDNYAQDWLEQLALHETRHVVQLDGLKQGMTKIAYYLIGEQAVGGISSLLPKWFLEGDAVYSETTFSNSGRGRSASFLMPYRALALSKGVYSYEKALLGSYRDNVPDVYAMGYPMIKTARDSFGEYIFAKSLKYTARNPYLLFPFGHSLKTNTKLNNKGLYLFTYSHFKKKDDYKTAEYEHWPVQETNVFTSYNFPIVFNENLILAQKWDLRKTRRIVSIDKNGKEKRLISIGTNSGERLSANGTKITWSENQTDIRWENRTYSRIYVYDFKSRKLKRFPARTWYLSPAFSPDGTKIAVIVEAPEYKSSLVILDAYSGKIIKSTPAPANEHLQQPLWFDSEQIYCLSVGDRGKSIIKLNKSDSWEDVLTPNFKDITSFCFADSAIIIAGEKDGINNLFAYNPSNKSFSQITFSEFGAFEPFFDANARQLLFSDYSSGGYRIEYVNWKPDIYPQISWNNYIAEEAQNLLNRESNLSSGTKKDKNYPILPYSKALHLLDVHSWLPAYFNYSVSDLSNLHIYPGLMVLSQNVLGTTVSQLGYSYRQGYSHFTSKITYSGIYPEITWNLDIGGLASRIGGNETYSIGNANNLQSNVNVSLPLTLSRRNLVSGLTPYVEWEYNRDAYFVNADKRYYQGQNFIYSGINYYLYRRMSTRDIYPRLGLSFNSKLKSSPFESKVFNNIFATSLRVYLPGLFQNHSLQVRYGYQHQSPLQYLYSSLLSFPSGYSSRRSETMHLINTSYNFPVCYPDIHAGPVFYLKRIRSNLFFDYAYNSYRTSNMKTIITVNENLRSMGADIIADVHFLRIMFPFQVGARIGYLPDQKKIFSEAIFSVNLVY